MGCRGMTAAMGAAVACAVGATACAPGGRAGEEGTGAPGGDSARDTGAAPVLVPPQGALLITELYYAGAVPTAGIDRYYADQFVTITNTGDGAVDLGGLVLGEVFGLAGRINAGDTPNAEAADPARITLQGAFRIPGAPGERLLAPGASVRICQDAANHAPYSPVESLDAPLEAFVDNGRGDLDNPRADNLEPLLFSGGSDWLWTVFGPSLVLLPGEAVAEPERARLDGWPVWRVPAAGLIDAVEALRSENAADYKRLHPALDAGFATVSGTYTGEALHRRSDGAGGFQDTNDSGADFTVAPPTIRP